MKRFVVLAALALLFSSDQGHAQDAKAAIEEGVLAWETAFNGGDGKAAIAEFWQGAIDSGLADADLEPVEVVEAGDIAYEVGMVTLSAPGSNGERVPVSGKYIVVWQRGDDGAWRLHRDIWNLNPGPAE